jgi:hypothetical protein
MASTDVAMVWMLVSLPSDDDAGHFRPVSPFALAKFTEVGHVPTRFPGMPLYGRATKHRIWVANEPVPEW